jgi:signal transduction histidine kinase
VFLRVVAWLSVSFVLWPVASTLAADRVSATIALPLLTTLRQLQSLSITEARRNYPLRVRATVTFFDPHFRILFVQDDTAGAWVYRDFGTNHFHAGQLLELAGVSDGVFGPALRPRSWRVIGTNALPEAYPVTYDQLASGREDAQRVQAHGVIRTMAYRKGFLRINVASGSENIPVYLPGFENAPLPLWLVGAQVEARGVCSMKLDGEGRVTGFWLYVANTNDLRVLRPGSPNPFALPAQPIRELWHYSNRRQSGAQIRVRGTVTFGATAERLFIRDDTAPLQVRLRAPWPHDDPKGQYHDPQPAAPVQPGDVVDVVGFFAPEFAPVLVDAEYRRVSAGPAPGPKPAQVEEVFRQRLESELISLNARLIELEQRRAGTNVDHVLWLQADGRTFEAVLPNAPAGSLPLRRDSVVRVTGINSLQLDHWRQTRSFRLLLRGANDVVVVQEPPRWTWRDAAKIGAGAGAVLVAALGWILVLRRKVHSQAELNERLEGRIAERTAELARSNLLLQSEVDERKRAHSDLARALESEKELNALKSNFVNVVSHEFRTPLGVILSSSEILDTYLDTLSPAERAEHMRDIKECTRYMSGLMEDVLMLGRVEAGKVQFRPIALDVAELFRRITDEVLSATNRTSAIEFSATNVEEPARGDESLLRKIFGNLLSNASKYSPPNARIYFSVTRDGHDAVFTVCDEGIGIPADDLKRLFTSFHRGSNVGERPGSGLGLVIVQRCVQLHGGTIAIESTEGAGTTVTVRLPLFAKTGHTEIVRRTALLET